MDNDLDEDFSTENIRPLNGFDLALLQKYYTRKGQTKNWFEHESVEHQVDKDVHDSGEHVYSDECIVCVDAVTSLLFSICYG